jgi:hypothetical protein
MPLTVTVGFSQKLGQPDYGSLGASCQVECEFDGGLLDHDPDTFQTKIREMYAACAQAVQDELARREAEEFHKSPAPTNGSRKAAKEPKASTASATKNGASNHQATSRQIDLGKQVHAALEWFYRNRQIGLEITPEQVCESMQRHWGPAAAEERIPFASSQEETEFLAKAMHLVRAYLLKTKHETTQVMAVETAVNTPLLDPRTGEDLGIPLLGVMDLVLGEAVGPVITDFKTAARADELSELTHEIQLGCYAYLFRHSTGTTESALEIRRLIKTKVPQILFHRWPARTERHFQRLLSVVRAYLDDLHSARYVFRPGHACSYCDFRERHCKDWAG